MRSIDLGSWLFVALAACSSSSSTTPSTTGDSGVAGDTANPEDSPAELPDTNLDDATPGGDASPDGATGACTIANDPCFKEFAAAFATTTSCFNHTNTCTASGGTDSSGCGTQSTDGKTCTWSDGSTITTTLTSTALEVVVKSGAGQTCYDLQTHSDASGTTATYLIGSQTFTATSVGTGTAAQVTLKCPDGKQVVFTASQGTGCQLGTSTCCTDASGACP